MKLRYKIINGIIGLLILACAVLAIVISYESDCTVVPPTGGDNSMRAVRYTCYGDADVLQLVRVERPVPAEGEVLVKVSRAGVNPLDWHYMHGSPYLMRLAAGIGSPDDTSLGVDFAGIVIGVGAGVTRFSVGDRVFGGRRGAFGEYLLVPADRGIAKIPDNVSFDQAAALPIAAVTALQAVRDKGGLQAGQKVLVNGASGGVGTYVVQIANSMGAEVHGVCSTRNVEMVRSLGADHVIDYKKTDYTLGSVRYDLIIDMVGNHSISANRGVMKPGGTLVMVGGKKGDWFAPLARPIGALVTQPFVDERIELILAELRPDDLEVLADMMGSGQLVSQIDQHFRFDDIAEAIRYSESGRARGKIIVDIN